MAGFSLDVNGLFSHFEIDKQVPNSKHTKVFIISAFVFQLGNVTRISFLLLQYENEQFGLAMSVTKKCCFCLCMFCSLASVAGPPVSMCCSSDKGGGKLSQVFVLFHQQKSGKFPGSHR